MPEKPTAAEQPHQARREAGLDALIRLRAMKAEFLFITIVGKDVPATTFEALWLPDVTAAIDAVERALCMSPRS